MGVHTGAELWHLLVGFVAFAGLVYRTWIVPMKKEREEIIVWRTRMEEDVKNNTGYIKRVEAEGKGVDGEHKTMFNEIKSTLEELKIGQAEIKADLKAHRESCEK